MCDKGVNTANNTAFSVQEPMRKRFLLPTVPLGWTGPQFLWNILQISLLGILSGTLSQATQVRPKHASWDNSCRTCSKFRNFQILQDFEKILLPAASTSVCILWLQRELPCSQARASLLAQELPMHCTISSCGFKGEMLCCGLEGCHSALQPRAWSGVRSNACAVCYKAHLHYRLI